MSERSYHGATPRSLCNHQPRGLTCLCFWWAASARCPPSGSRSTGSWWAASPSAGSRWCFPSTCWNTETTRKEWYVSFNDALDAFYLRLYGIRHVVKDHSDSERGLLFLICSIIYASSHRWDSTYQFSYTSRGALAGTRNSSMGPPWRIDLTIHRTMSECYYHGATSHSHKLRLTHQP